MTTVKAVAVSLVVFTALTVLLAGVGNAGAGELLLVLVVAAIAGFAYRRTTTAVRSPGLPPRSLAGASVPQPNNTVWPGSSL